MMSLSSTLATVLQELPKNIMDFSLRCLHEISGIMARQNNENTFDTPW